MLLALDPTQEDLRQLRGWVSVGENGLRISNEKRDRLFSTVKLKQFLHCSLGDVDISEVLAAEKYFTFFLSKPGNNTPDLG